MANIFDYLNWRGELTVAQAGFNNVDALILSRLSYIPFEGAVLDDLLEKTTIGLAADTFLAQDSPSDKVNVPQDVELLRRLAKSERFKDMLLSGYVNEIDYDKQKQFSAITIDLTDNTHFISFRGTDNTLVGWKEDFNMSFMTPVPAQEDAVGYMEAVAAKVPGYIRAGGHSKGGNLAVYAASFCSEPVRERITGVYNFDGPGFDASVLSQNGYAAIRERIRTFVPQSSVVGMMLEHEEEYLIVSSKQIGLLQHDLYSWEVMGNDLIYLETVTNSSKFIDRTLKNWVSKMEPDQREQVIDAVYGVLKSTDAKTIKELSNKWYKNAQSVVKSLTSLDEPMKQVVSQTLFLLLSSAKENLIKNKPQISKSNKGDAMQIERPDLES